MIDELTKRIKNVEEELVRLKTARQYTSIKSANSAQISVHTGMYRVTYAGSNGQIISEAFTTLIGRNYASLRMRPPSDNYQDVEVKSYYWDSPTQQFIDQTITLSVVANYPIVSIERIS